MSKFLQQMPMSLKLFAAGSLLATMLFAGAVMSRPRHRFIPEDLRTAAASGQQLRAGDGGRTQALGQWRARQAQLQGLMQRCQVEMNRVTDQMRQAAMSGSGMMPPPPACQQSMPYWISQEALAETEIHRLETGDTTSDVYDVSGIPRPSGSSGSSSSGGSDDGTGAVEDWDRGAIRETGMYAGEDGEQYELPNNGYHYKDRNSGQIITTNSPDAPNDGRDYEPLQPVQRH